MARVITVNDVLDGHVTLDIECLDRIYQCLRADPADQFPGGGVLVRAPGVPFVDHGVLDAAAGRLRELADPVTAGGEVVLHGDFYLGNVLAHDGHVSALIDFESSRITRRQAGTLADMRCVSAAETEGRTLSQ